MGRNELFFFLLFLLFPLSSRSGRERKNSAKNRTEWGGRKNKCVGRRRRKRGEGVIDDSCGDRGMDEGADRWRRTA